MMFGKPIYLMGFKACMAKVFFTVSAVTMGRESSSFLVTRLAVNLKIFIGCHGCC
jgi:hypothetical protein